MASTCILSRVSLLEHAAINCGRRLFAVTVTSIFFRNKVTVMKIVGAGLTIGGFAVFSWLKEKRRLGGKSGPKKINVMRKKHFEDEDVLVKIV